MKRDSRKVRYLRRPSRNEDLPREPIGQEDLSILKELLRKHGVDEIRHAVNELAVRLLWENEL